MAWVRRSFLLSVLYCFGFVAIFRKVSAEKSGWLCESAFHDDTPAVYFEGQEIINACVSMNDKFRDIKDKNNKHWRSCSLLPDRQCIASRYKFLNIPNGNTVLLTLYCAWRGGGGGGDGLNLPLLFQIMMVKGLNRCRWSVSTLKRSYFMLLTDL